jgi:hypothetical protein
LSTYVAIGDCDYAFDPARTLLFSVFRSEALGAGETLPLRDAGCREAWIGADSGGQRVADAMNKGTKVE